MTAEEVMGIRDRSEAWKKGQTGPWKTDFNEMAKKTVIRNAFKMWPKSGMDRAEEAVKLSNDNEGFEPIETTPEVKQFNVDEKSYFDQMISSEDAMGMHVFRLTTSESVYTNLYHSFPKGQKGKYQKIVDRLDRDGLSVLTSCVDGVVQAVQENDVTLLQETIEDLGDSEMDIIKERLTPEQHHILREMTNE